MKIHAAIQNNIACHQAVVVSILLHGRASFINNKPRFVERLSWVHKMLAHKFVANYWRQLFCKVLNNLLFPCIIILMLVVSGKKDWFRLNNSYRRNKLGHKAKTNKKLHYSLSLKISYCLSTVSTLQWIYLIKICNINYPQVKTM